MDTTGIPAGLAAALEAVGWAMPLALAGLCILIGAAGLVLVLAEVRGGRRDAPEEQDVPEQPESSLNTVW